MGKQILAKKPRTGVKKNLKGCSLANRKNEAFKGRKKASRNPGKLLSKRDAIALSEKTKVDEQQATKLRTKARISPSKNFTGRFCERQRPLDTSVCEKPPQGHCEKPAQGHSEFFKDESLTSQYELHILKNTYITEGEDSLPVIGKTGVWTVNTNKKRAVVVEKADSVAAEENSFDIVKAALRDYSVLTKIVINVHTSLIANPQKNLDKLGVLIDVLQGFYNACFLDKREDELRNPLLMALIATGAIFEAIMPSYTIVESPDRTSKAVGVIMDYEMSLMKQYTRFLTDILLNIMKLDRVGIYRREERFFMFLSRFSKTARNCNHSSEFMIDYVRLILYLSPECHPISKAELTLIEGLESTLMKDMTLSITKTILKQILLELKGKKQWNREAGVAVVDSFKYMDIERKELCLEKELKAFSELKGTKNEDVMVSAKPEKFKAQKNAILTDIMVFYLSVMRAATVYPIELVIASLRGITEQTRFVNIELLDEVKNEIRNMCQVYFRYSKLKGAVIFGCVSAVLNMTRKIPVAAGIEVNKKI